MKKLVLVLLPVSALLLGCASSLGDNAEGDVAALRGSVVVPYSVEDTNPISIAPWWATERAWCPLGEM